ncbi:hypothetical protein Ahy_A09g043948 [Arachis hypogaea]|uniref:Uncharacterized protein n=1 Tax=Arachis hypogaea TaxID=3818 RepID=A0A445BJA4_ARAHY|nr:hypothetical protein Ahy_A09g043948 [Arachis hypogaea]
MWEKCYQWMTQLKVYKDTTNEYDTIFMLDHKAHLKGNRFHFMSLTPGQDVVNAMCMVLNNRKCCRFEEEIYCLPTDIVQVPQVKEKLEEPKPLEASEGSNKGSSKKETTKRKKTAQGAKKKVPRGWRNKKIPTEDFAPGDKGLITSILDCIMGLEHQFWEEQPPPYYNEQYLSQYTYPTQGYGRFHYDYTPSPTYAYNPYPQHNPQSPYFQTAHHHHITPSYIPPQDIHQHESPLTYTTFLPNYEPHSLPQCEAFPPLTQDRQDLQAFLQEQEGF